MTVFFQPNFFSFIFDAGDRSVTFDGSDFLVVNPFMNEVSCQFIGNRPFCGQTLAGPNKKSDVSIGPFLRFSFLPRHNGVLF